MTLQKSWTIRRVRTFIYFFLILFCFTCKATEINNVNLAQHFFKPTSIQLSVTQERNVLSKFFFGKIDSEPSNEFKLVFYIIKRFLSIDENLQLIVACGKNFNLNKMFGENDIVHFPNFSFCLIYIKQPILIFKKSKICIPLVNTVWTGVRIFRNDTLKLPPPVVLMNSFLEIQNIKSTQGGHGLFHELQKVNPSSRLLETLNQKYLLLTHSTTLNNTHIFLLTVETNEIKILIHSDKFALKYDRNADRNAPIPMRRIICLYKKSDNFLNPPFIKFLEQKIEVPHLSWFDFCDSNLILLEKSRAYSKKTIFKILYKWMNFYLKYEIFVNETLFSFLISRTNKNYTPWQLLYKQFIGQPLLFIPMYLETQILFTPLLIENPEYIFLTMTLSTYTQFFHTILFVNRNITAFQIPRNEYWIYITMKSLKNGFKYNFLRLYMSDFILIYLFLLFIYPCLFV